MRIYDLKVEHKTEPLGIDGNDPLFSFLCDEGGTFSVAVFDSDGNAVAEKAVAAPENGGFRFGRSFCGRFEWTVSFGSKKSSSRFETFEKFDAPFITPKDKTLFSPYVFRGFTLEKSPVSARLKITGLGLYRAFLNGKRVGKTYLTPGFNDYGSYLRVGTYDVSEMLDEGENELGVFLGDGWYRGEIGLERKKRGLRLRISGCRRVGLDICGRHGGGTANGRKLARPRKFLRGKLDIRR